LVQILPREKQTVLVRGVLDGGFSSRSTFGCDLDEASCRHTVSGERISGRNFRNARLVNALFLR
jgi:hypothetical protein